MQVVSKSFLGDTNHCHAEEHLSSSTDTSTENTIYSEEMKEPRSKRFKHLHLKNADRAFLMMVVLNQKKDVTLEIEHYIKHKQLDDLSDDDPFNIWLDNAILSSQNIKH